MATPFLLTDDQMRGAIIAKEVSSLVDEIPALDTYRDYYNGEQSLVYGTEKFKEQFGDAFVGFKDNFCRVVVEAVTDKMQVKGIRLGLPGTDPTPTEITLASDLWRQFLLRDFDETQSDLFVGSCVEGRATLMLWPDGDGGVKIDWNPAQLVRVRYSDDDATIPVWATKRWVTADGAIYVTYVTPESVYKYVETEGEGPTQRSDMIRSPLDQKVEMGSGRVFTPRIIEGEPWPLPNPFNRVNVIEFSNVDKRSELADVIPQQDAINYILRNQLVAAEFAAFRQRVMVTSQEEPAGGWKSSPGIVWQLKPTFNPDGSVTIPSFGTFDVSDPTTYSKIVEMYLQHMAHTTKTPTKAFFESDRGGRGDAASGESLKVEDKPTIDKILRKERRIGNRLFYATRLISEVTAGAPSFDELPLGEIIWTDPRSEYRMALLEEALKMADLGLPRKYIYKTLGLSSEEQSQVEKWREEELDENAKRALDQAEAQAEMMPASPPVSPASPSPRKSGSASGPGPSTTAKA